MTGKPLSWKSSDLNAYLPHNLELRAHGRHLPPHRIRHRIAEESQEGGLEEGVELGEGLAALGAQGVRRVQNARDPLLLGEGREGDL